MSGPELTTLMNKGTVFVEFHGETYEVVQKFKHTAWIKRNGIKKSIPFRFFNFKVIIEGNIDTSKIFNKRVDEVKLKELWKTR